MMKCQCCKKPIRPHQFNFCPYCGIPIDEEIAEKEEFWMWFSTEVVSKAIPAALDEYGDFNDDDNLEKMDANELLSKLSTLADRYSQNGGENDLDILHLAHLVALIYYKEFEE